MGVHIVGVSFDAPAKNKVFKTNEKFQYPLWSDVKRELALAYGAALTPDFPIAMRITVVLDPAGQWVLNYPSVSVSGHPAKVLADMKAILAK